MDEARHINGKQDEGNPLVDYEVADSDSCSTEEINLQFSARFIEVKFTKITNSGVCCSSFLADNHETNIASVLSDKSVVILDKERFQISKKFQPHKKNITGIKFSETNPNLIYTSSIDGMLKIWDARSNVIEREINANTDNIKRPLSTFDISVGDRLACVGTELVGQDSYLLFFDLREDKLLGGYWNSHSDDISYLKFHPKKSDYVASAGADGLLNVFDVSKSSETDALMYCLNTEVTVNMFNWIYDGKRSRILAYTDVNSVQLWDIEEAFPKCDFSREKITKALRRSVSYECYPIPTSLKGTTNTIPFILAGSGLEHERTSCLRTLHINEVGNRLDPHGLLVHSKDDKLSASTQVASYCSESQELITVRDDGIVSLWKEKGSSDENSFKIKNGKKTKGTKSKPY